MRLTNTIKITPINLANINEVSYLLWKHAWMIDPGEESLDNGPGRAYPVGEITEDQPCRKTQ